jgi:glycosyltransferase involved in cell wall biosynthesis
LKKNRIAIWLQGGIGGGNFSQGYPALLNFVSRLTAFYDVTVYSILPANADFVPRGFVFRSVHHSIGSSRIRSILLCFLFIFDHFRRRYSLVHAFWAYPAGLLSVIISKLVRIPCMVTIQGGEGARIPSIAYGNMINPVVRKLTLWTCRHATCLTSISHFLANEIRRHGLKRNDIIVIPFGPDINTFQRTNKLQGPTLKIIHVANLTEVKDQATLLQAFKLISDKQSAALRIVGGGSLKETLVSLSHELNLTNHVSFLDAIPQSELPLHYDWADMMLHTSLHEGQSGVVVEAMASEVVVCGTRVGIMADLESTNSCAVVDIGDYRALSEMVLRIWHNKEEFKIMQATAYHWVTGHTLSWTIKEFYKLYEKVINPQYPSE